MQTLVLSSGLERSTLNRQPMMFCICEVKDVGCLRSMFLEHNSDRLFTFSVNFSILFTDHLAVFGVGIPIHVCLLIVQALDFYVPAMLVSC